MCGGPTAFAACGGTERWFVKVGTDPDAGLVQLNQVVSITVAGLNNLPKLQSTVPHGDNKFRLPEERVVYQVSGRLVLFKDEDDGDYHLVVTDDSLNYTPGGQGSNGLGVVNIKPLLGRLPPGGSSPPGGQFTSCGGDLGSSCLDNVVR